MENNQKTGKPSGEKVRASVYKPRKGYARKDYSSKSEREKDYQNPMSFDLLIGAGRKLTEDNRVQRLEALEQSFQLLKDAGLIESKMQFAGGILQMYRTPIPIADAAALCNCSRQWFRNLEDQGRIKILRTPGRKCFILPEELIRIMEARI